MNCIDCSYSLIKDSHYNCTYEEGECIKISLLEKENAELKEQIEKMKCCGNCSHFKLDNSGIYPVYVCELIYPNRCKNHDKWEWEWE